jgi:putative Mn2+ efflux pump MntP
MIKRALNFLGAILIFAGAFLIIIQPLQPITGAAIIDLSTTTAKMNFTAGLIIIIIGILVLYKSIQKAPNITPKISKKKKK